MTPIRTERLVLRLWEERDRPVFHRLGSDERVMGFFAFRRSREEADAEMDRWNADGEREGFTFFAVETVADGAVIGMTGLGRVAPNLPCAPAVQIGWRLVPEATGKGYATEAAAACLALAFDEHGLDEVVSMCALANTTSEAVMQRLGLVPDGSFDHPAVDPATHPHLVRHRLYRIARAEWRAAEDRSPRQARRRP